MYEHTKKETEALREWELDLLRASLVNGRGPGPRRGVRYRSNARRALVAKHRKNLRDYERKQKWCHGVKGREHKLRVVHKGINLIGTCHKPHSKFVKAYPKTDPAWVCYHSVECKVCGVTTVQRNEDKWRCPNYLALTRGKK